MLIYRSPQQLSRIRKPIVLAAGAFDGVHVGHRSVIRDAVRAARAEKGEAWILSFDPHPLRVLRPELAPNMLTSKDHKLRLLHTLGVDGCLMMRFTHALARVEPEDFIASLKRGAPGLKRMVVGSNWTFGRRARGNVNLLKQLAELFGFSVTIARPRRWRGAPISSTRIREAVSRGRLEEARAMLGRPFSIRGDVVHGKKLGRKLGYPTANVDPHNEVRPPAGIYAAHAHVRGQDLPAAVYIGSKSDIVEVHFIGCDLDLYGQEIELFFVKKIRGDRKFKSRAALTRQIAKDVRDAARMLAG